MMVTLRLLSEAYMYGAIQQWNKGILNLLVNNVSKKLTTLTIFNSIQKNNLKIFKEFFAYMLIFVSWPFDEENAIECDFFLVAVDIFSVNL